MQERGQSFEKNLLTKREGNCRGRLDDMLYLKLAQNVACTQPSPSSMPTYLKTRFLSKDSSFPVRAQKSPPSEFSHY